jgi:hypothetical protein
MNKIELKVIDVARITTDMLNRYPHMVEKYRGEGRLLLVDQSAHEAKELPIHTPAMMKLENGEEIEILISSASDNRGAFTLFLKDYGGPEITGGATICWNEP